ncbi:MAG: hypothetical protein AB1414_20375 [bacterium]
MKKNRALTPLGEKAEKAMKDAVKKVIVEHTIKKLPLVIWENGKVVKVEPDKISVVRKDSTQ